MASMQKNAIKKSTNKKYGFTKFTKKNTVIGLTQISVHVWHQNAKHANIKWR